MIKNRIRRAFQAATLLLAAACTAPAATVVTSFDDITHWTGTGSNRAALVIDWNDGTTPSSFVWGFRWNGTATGETMFRAIAGSLATANFPDEPGAPAPDGSGDTALTLFILSYSFGPSVDRITYGTHDQNSDAFFNGYWQYWNTSGAAPTPWVAAEVGFADRPLANHSWDGWSFIADPNDFTGFAPDMGVAAVPEPAPLALLCITAGLLLILHLRRRHA